MIEADRTIHEQTPEISVLMPVYNAARFLETAIESVLSQTFGAFEFVIVDDGSTDVSADIIHSYSRQDARIHPIYQEHHGGIVNALNSGLDACTGEFIARMDADDVALPDRLALQLRAMAENPKVGALGGALTYINESGKELGVIRHCDLQTSRLAGNPLLHPTVMMRRTVLIQHRLHYQEKYRYAEDYFLWLEMQQFAAIDALDDVVLQYRVSDAASRHQHLKEMIRATLRVKRDAIWKLGIKPAPADIARMVSESVLLLLPTPWVWWLYRRITQLSD
jgi:glycosyltransferase involved in cell wall biosynthesis